MVRYLLFLFSIVLSAPAFSANQSLQFKSENLNALIAIFKEASPELVREGVVEVSYCGAYDAYTSIQNITKEISGNYVVMTGDVPSWSVYLGMGLDHNEAADFASKVAKFMKYRQPWDSLQYGELWAFEQSNELHKRANYNVAGVVVWDRETQEYVLISGDRAQNDCD